jgi:hypothetical protein
MTTRWKRFAFFDKDVVSEKIDTGFNSVPTCARAEGGLLVFGDANGNISIADHNLVGLTDQRFKAFRGEVKAVSYLFDPGNHRRQFVVAVGDDTRPRIAADGKVVSTIAPSYVVKVFNMADTSRPINVFLASPGVSALLSSFAVLPDGSQIAVGFTNRTVLLFSGSFLKEGSMLRQVTPEVILDPRPAYMPVTGLHFVEISKPNSKTSANTTGIGSEQEKNGVGAVTHRRTRLFVVIDIDVAVAAAADANSVPNIDGDGADDLMRQRYPGTFGSSGAGSGAALSASDVLKMAQAGVMLLDTSVVVTENASNTTTVVPAANRNPYHPLDDTRGAGKFCSCLMPDTYELLVGRAEGVFSYSMDDRGGAAGFEGDKQCIGTVGRYVLVGSTDLKSRRTGITIYDLRNKFISMHSQLAQGERVALLLHDGRTAYVVTTAFTVIRFREKSTQAKLDVLLRKELYPAAITLAAEEQCEATEIVKLYRTYGDYLYKKGDFDGSMEQYCHTIGSLQPSYVVRRFLDPHRVGNLVTYLEKLRERGLATNDHAVLLLTCYVKMESTDKIKRYIYSCNNPPRTSQYAPGAGAANSAVSGTALSRSHSAATHEAELQAQWQPDETLTAAERRDYASTGGIVNLKVDVSIETLKNGGMVQEALTLAKRCGRHVRAMELLLDRATDENGISAAMQHLTELVCSISSADLVGIIRAHGPRLLKLRPDVITALFVRLVTGDLDALRQREVADIRNLGDQAPLVASISVDDVSTIYVDNTQQLRVFLSAVLDHRRAHHGAPLPALAAETLLEMCLQDYQAAFERSAALQSAKAPRAEQAAARNEVTLQEKKVRDILDGQWTDTYDSSQALLLAHAANCEPAVRFLLDKANSSELLLSKYIESGDEKGIIKILRREGRKDPELYVQVLTHFLQLALAKPKDEVEAEERWDLVNETLRLVETEGALSPMQVVQIVSQHPEAPLSLVARFIGSQLESACEDVAALERSVASLAQTLECLENGDDMAPARTVSTGSRRSASPSPVPFSPTKGNGNGGTGASPAKQKQANTAAGAGGSAGSRFSNRRKADGHYGSDSGESRGDSDPFSDEDEDADEDNASVGSSKGSVTNRDRQVLELHELAAEKEKWSKIKATAIRRASEHESFFAELEGSEDGFSTVAAAFGKTMISP